MGHHTLNFGQKQKDIWETILRVTYNNETSLPTLSLVPSQDVTPLELTVEITFIFDRPTFDWVPM